MNRTLVISIDALITADIQRLKELTHLGKIMKKASWVEDIFCIYPTLTYPCHATITTGCWPDRHGIINNEKFQPLAEDRADWFWFRDAIGSDSDRLCKTARIDNSNGYMAGNGGIGSRL